MLSDASAAFENMATKEEIACFENFLLLSPCFQLYSIQLLYFHLKGVSNKIGYVFKVICFRFVVCGERFTKPYDVGTQKESPQLVSHKKTLKKY